MLSDQRSRYCSTEGSAERENPQKMLQEIRAALDQAQRDAAESQLRLEAAQRVQEEWREQHQKLTQPLRSSAVVVEAQKALERARKFREDQRKSQQQTAEFSTRWQDCLGGAALTKTPQEVLGVFAAQQPEEDWLSLASRGLTSKRVLEKEWDLSDSSFDSADRGKAQRATVTPKKEPGLRCSVEKMESQNIEPRPRKETLKVAPVAYAVPCIYPVFQPMQIFAPCFAAPVMPYSPPSFWGCSQSSAQLKTPCKRTVSARNKADLLRQTASERKVEKHSATDELPSRAGEWIAETNRAEQGQIECLAAGGLQGEEQPRQADELPAESLQVEQLLSCSRSELVIDEPSGKLSEAYLARHKLAPAPDTRIRKTKSREELLQIRKKMLKPQQQAKPLPKTETLQRLVEGKRAAVSKKEMFALTAKNYQQLPEVQMKNKDEAKRDELLQRLASAKAYARRDKPAVEKITLSSDPTK